MNAPTLEFRIAAPHEAERLLGAGKFTPTLAALAARERALLVNVDGEPGALAFFTGDELVVEIEAIVVAPALRGGGIGKSTIAFLRGPEGRSVRALLPAEGAAVAPMFAALGGPLEVFAGYSVAVPVADRLATELSGSASLAVRPIQIESDLRDLFELDRLAGNPCDRALHEALGTLAQGLLFARPDGEIAAYLYVFPDGEIGPGAAAGSALLGDAILFALSRLRGIGRDLARVRIPLANPRLAQLLRRCGGSIVDLAVAVGEPLQGRAVRLPRCGMLRGESAGRSSAW
ncbi:MAG: hypothetical protein ACP5O6_07095 [Candidatus Baltobacteraceae bacterium]